MASTVLSGFSNVTYTNSTGQNVRVVINYMGGVVVEGAPQISMSWGGGGASGIAAAIGRNLAFAGGFIRPTTTTPAAPPANNALGAQASGSNFVAGSAFPTEIMLAAGSTFSATCSAYNIVVIPEAG